jgi:hypothetical protein
MMAYVYVVLTEKTGENTGIYLSAISDENALAFGKKFYLCLQNIVLLESKQQ